jgi:hypothetical protein
MVETKATQKEKVILLNVSKKWERIIEQAPTLLFDFKLLNSL